MNNIRHTIIDITHETRDASSRHLSQWFMTFSMAVIVLFTFISVIIGGVMNQFSKETELNWTILRKLSELNEEFNLDHSKGEGESEISLDIIQDIIKEKYIGNWTTVIQANEDSNLTQEIKGRVDVRFNARYSTKKDTNENELFMISIKCYEGIFIDNWQSFDSVINSSSLRIRDNIQSSLTLEGNFTSIKAKGQLFNIGLKPIDCSSRIAIELIKDSNGLIDFNHIIIDYRSSCGNNFHLSLEQNTGKHSNSLREKISFYTFIASTTATISMIVNFFLIKLLTQAESNIKVMSITSISINAIWNLFSFLINFSFAIQFSDHFFQFLIPSILFLCLFLLVDIQFFYYYFIIRRKTLSDRDVTRRTIVFGVLFSIGLLVSGFVFYDFYFGKIGMMCLAISLWTPQIVHNILRNNNTALPIVYTVLATLARMSIPLYFRGFANNCFSIKPDGILIAKCMIIDIFLMIFLASQSFLGSRWFLPKCLRKNLKEEIYFYSQKVAMELFPNYLDEECVICLNRLFNNAIPLPDVIEGQSTEANTPSLYNNIKNDNAPYSAPETSSNQSIIGLISSVAWSALLDFHEWKIKQKKNNLPYMITQCNHLFHSQCLELWLRQVKKCPSCRKEITIIPI